MNNKNTLQAGERSDCTVRALVKTAGLAYEIIKTHYKRVSAVTVQYER